MIFKTFNSDIDNISSKWGLFGKSFYDVSTDIEKRWNNVSKTLQATNDYTLQNITNAWKMGNSNPIKFLADNEVVSILDRYNKALDSGAEATARFLNNGTGNEFMDGFLKDLDGAPATMDKYKVATKNATMAQKNFSASTIATKAAVLALNVAVSMGLSIALSALIKTISEVVQSEENLKDTSRELGSELSNNVSTIEDYKEKINDLKSVLSDNSSSFDDVSQARADLMVIQDELIKKFGTEKGVIEDITEAIYGQTDALDQLSKDAYYEAVDKFNQKTSGDKFVDWLTFGNTDDNRVQSNMDKMVSQMESSIYSLETTGNEVLDNLIAKSLGLTISSDTYGDGKHFTIYGELDEIQEKLTAIREMASDFDVSAGFENNFTDISNDVNSLLEAHQSLYEQYVLWEKILTDNPNNQYDEQYNLINQAKKSYDEAMKSGDNETIQKASEEYSKTLSSAIDLAMNNYDYDVASYFGDMYPDMQQMFSEWKFTLDFEPNTDGLKDKVSNSLIGLEGFSSEDLMGFNPNVATEEQINAYGELNNVASEYGLTLKGLINLLMQMGLIQSENYQQLVDTFGQEAVDKLTPEDLEIAYTISSEEADKALEQEKNKIKSELESLSKEGNVDLTIRPIIDSSAMQAAGWDVEDGSIATTFTQGEFIWQGDEENGQYVYIHYTPILPDGTVLTPDELTDYLYGTLEGSQSVLDADNKGIVLKVDTDLNIPEGDIKKFTNGEGSTNLIDGLIQKTGEWDDKVHSVQEQYYDTGEGIGYASNALDGLIEKHKQLENPDEKPVSFIGFSEEQSKAIDDFESKVKTLSSALESIREGKTDNGFLTNLIQEFPKLQGQSENLEQAIVDLINNSLNELYNTLGEGLPNNIKDDLQSIADAATNVAPSLDEAFSSIQKSYEVLNDFEEAQKGLGITSDVLNSVASLSTEMENLVAQYYAGLVGADELYAGLTEHYNNDMENYANALIAKNANSEQFYQSTGMMSAEVINSFMEDYNVDLSNCKTYNEAKLAIEQQALQKVSTMWAKYYDAQAKTINATGKHLLEQAETLKALDENAYHNFMSANDLYGFQNVVNTYKEASEALNDITFNGIESNFKLTSKNIAKTTNAAKGAGRSAKEAGNSAKEAKDEFEELFDFFERRVKVLDNAFDLLKANLDNVTGSFAKNNLLGAQQDILETKIDEYTAAASMYQQKANEALSKLDSDIQEKIKAGAVNLTEFVGDANKEVVETIKDFETWADKVSDCNQELAELGKTISQIELNKFENIMQDFNDQYNIRDSGKDIINKQIELFKESGQVIGEPFYQELIRQTEKQITGGEQEKNKLVEQLNDSLSSGKITVGSEEWVKEIGYLSDLEGQILDNKKAVEEYDNQILQLHWDSFDREKQQFSNLNDEISNLKDLLGDSDVADENGTWTKEGIAQLGLMAQQYELAEYNVKRYNDEIEWLNKEYLAGNYSTTEYADKLAELKKEQWDSVKASESAKDAIVELNKARIDIAIKGIEKEIDAFKKLTEAQLETLESSKNLHDYEKSISEKNKSIVQLQRQLAAMANDTSAAAMAKKAKLEEQLAEAKEALEEEQYQHSIDAQKEALNKQAEDYEQSKNYEIESLQKTLEERETLIAESFETVKMNAETVGAEIDRIAQEHGITVSQALTEPWKKGELAIASYGETLTPQTSYFIEILGGITRAIESIKIEADQTAFKLSELFGSHTNRLVDDLNAAYTSADNLNKMTSGLQSAFSELFGGNYNTGGISGALNSIKGAIDGVTSAANAASQAIANMGAAKVQSSTPPPGQTSKPSRVEMFGSGATATFVTKDDSGKTHGVYKTAEEATEALKKKKNKYASGTRNAKAGLRITDEQGNELVLPKLAEGRYTIGNAGDQILTKVQTDNIFDWSKFNPNDLVPYNMFGSLNMTPPEISTRDVNNNTPVQIGNLISVQGNIDSSNIKQMESIANKAVDNLVYKMSKGIKYGRI